MTLTEGLSQPLRPAGALAPVGGDEFVVVAEALADTDPAVEQADRVVTAGRSPVPVGDAEFLCPISAGLTCAADEAQSTEDRLGQAHLALYRAKTRGPNRVQVFDEALLGQSNFARSRQSQRRHVVADGRILAEYEPVIDLSSRNGPSAR